jgi:L-alanine-DL-glutamate epimerase-like enolase superfamily enzyme
MLAEPTTIDADGFVTLPETPGLGIELDEERIKAHGEEL